MLNDLGMSKAERDYLLCKTSNICIRCTIITYSVVGTGNGQHLTCSVGELHVHVSKATMPLVESGESYM